MASVKLGFYSHVLGRHTEVNVLLPQNTTWVKECCRPPFPVLYLLHGLSEDHNAWLRNSSIERYAGTHNLCVVMPGTDRGFYCDTAYGVKYYTYIAEELPELLAGYFPLSRRREDTYVCGLSMGGYGALKLALRQPERFSMAGALSAAPISAFMAEQMAKQDTPDPLMERENQHVFGETTKPEDDLFALLDACADHPQKPRFYVCCGESDFLYPLNLVMKDKLTQRGYDLIWRSDPGEGHAWHYWDARIQDFLSMLPPQTAGHPTP